MALLQLIFEDVFQPNHSDAETEEKAGLYGICLATTSALKDETKTVRLIQQVFSKLMERFTDKVCWYTYTTVIHNLWNLFYPSQLKLESGCSDAASTKFKNPSEKYLEKAVEVAWKMLTIQPPMIVSFPSKDKYNKDVHDPDGPHWDTKLTQLEESKLIFFQPALYYSHKSKKPKVKAEVGNMM